MNICAKCGKERKLEGFNAATTGINFHIRCGCGLYGEVYGNKPSEIDGCLVFGFMPDGNDRAERLAEKHKELSRPMRERTDKFLKENG